MNALLIFLLFTGLAALPPPIPSPQSSAFRGNPTTISVQLRGQSGFPIENATIYFFHETHNELLGTAVTNSEGFAQYIWMIPVTHDLGVVQLNATFRGDPERYLLPSMVPIPITIFGRIQNNVNVTDENGDLIGSSVRIGQHLYFHTLITDENFVPLDSITVQFVMEPDILLAEKSTTPNGSLVFSCFLNHTLEHDNIFTIRSLNQGYLNGTETSFHLPIQNSDANFVGLPMFWHPTFGFSLQGKLCTQSGYGIPNVTIELEVDSGIILKNTQTNDEGDFFIDLYDVIESVQQSAYLILQYNDTQGRSRTRSIIKILSSPPHNPFTQSIEPTSSIALFSLSYQLSIITISCLTAGTSLLAFRMRRTTKRFISH